MIGVDEQVWFPEVMSSAKRWLSSGRADGDVQPPSVSKLSDGKLANAAATAPESQMSSGMRQSRRQMPMTLDRVSLVTSPVMTLRSHCGSTPMLRARS